MWNFALTNKLTEHELCTVYVLNSLDVKYIKRKCAEHQRTWQLRQTPSVTQLSLMMSLNKFYYTKKLQSLKFATTPSWHIVPAYILLCTTLASKNSLNTKLRELI